MPPCIAANDAVELSVVWWRQCFRLTPLERAGRRSERPADQRWFHLDRGRRRASSKLASLTTRIGHLSRTDEKPTEALVARHLETFESYSAHPGRNERILLLITLAVLGVAAAAAVVWSLIALLT